MLIQHNAGTRPPQKPRQRALTLLDRRGPQIFAVELEEIESAQFDIMIVMADHFEHGESVVVARNRLAVDQE
jgi:hypothetical protein